MAPSSGGRSTRGRSAIPELPEVETVRRELAPWLSGRRIEAATRVDAPLGPKTADVERAVGQHIEGVWRRGKFLLLPLRRDDAAVADELVIHLGMTGVISSEPPRGHLRLTLSLDGPRPNTLYFRDPRRFGRFLVVPRGVYATLPTLAAMGPEPLEGDFTVAGFAAALARSRAPIKGVLLAQRAVSGVGNIYADEVLWRTRIHPLTPAVRLSRAQVRALHTAIREVLTAAVEMQGTTLYDYRTVNGEVGSYLEKLDAYGHTGDPCPRCGTPLERMVVVQRGTHLCPRCQKLPRGGR
jgi:formamidopyrimidine-DNA glycosylase